MALSRVPTAGTCAVLVLAGLLFATTAGAARGTDLRPGERGDLADVLRREQRGVETATRRVQALRDDIGRRTAQVAGRDAGVGQAQDEADALGRAVGLEPVRGPGLTVVLDDAPRGSRAAAPERTSPDDLVVHQQDVQAVVNALWAGGAEALQLMDQRVIATSAVRCVGNTLILQGRVYSPPYAVTAIGPVASMRAALEESEGVTLFREYVDLLGLRYEVQAHEETTLPGYTGSLDLLHARMDAESDT